MKISLMISGMHHKGEDTEIFFDGGSKVTIPTEEAIKLNLRDRLYLVSEEDQE